MESPCSAPIPAPPNARKAHHPADLEKRLGRLFARETAGSLEFEALTEEERRLLVKLSASLVAQPTRSSRDLAAELGVQREDLVRYYRLIRESQPVQEMLTFESPFRRRVSFLRRELQTANLSTLQSMFRGEVCLPNHVEFHPALLCNLRCRACPNCRADSSGEWHFLGYQRLGQPLTPERLQLIQQMCLDLGVESFSFGGGGEPSLSDLTVPGIAALRRSSASAEISLYTNGIFPPTWADPEYETLVGCLNKVRFSIDAANAQEWSQYKGRAPELFETLWGNIRRLVEAKRRSGGAARIGASCLVSNFTSSVEAFLLRARDTGLDFCDVKEVETCYGEKSEVTAVSPAGRRSLEPLWEKVRNGCFAPLDVVIDDSLLRPVPQARPSESTPARCWVAIRGRMLTVGPYGELYPCSDAANPGSQYRRAHKETIGQLVAFDSAAALKAQFTTLWRDSLPLRTALSRADCAYCVPSHNNFNLAVEKLFQDWQYGISPEEQPFAAGQDHYQKSRGLRR